MIFYLILVDGGFSEWSSWTSCTATCDGGRHNRSRSCTDPAPMYLGADCVGAEEEEDDCNTQNCPSKYNKTSLI